MLEGACAIVPGKSRVSRSVCVCLSVCLSVCVSVSVLQAEERQCGRESAGIATD